MRRARIALVLAAVGVLAAPPSAARASTFEESGWWWRAQTGLVVAVPAPPDVPEDGLAVGRTPDGPTEVAAVRYRLDDDERDPVLTLHVEEERGGENAGILACATTDHWGSARAGRWDARPECADGSAAVAGVRAEDGGSWSFELSPLLDNGGVLNVVLHPSDDPTPFRVTFQPLSDANLRTTRGEEGGEFEAPPVSAFTPGSGSAAGPPSGVAIGVPASGTVRQGDAPPLAAGPAEPPAAAQPAPPPQIAPQAAPPPLAAPAAPGLDPTWLAFALLGLVALVAYDLRRQDAPPPRKLGRLAGVTPEEPVRGLGRFARPRSDAPKPFV